MKHAAIQDAWRHLGSSLPRPGFLRAFGIRSLSTTGEVSAALSTPLTVLCGANGAGKSTILSALAASFDEAHLDLRQRITLNGAEVWHNWETKGEIVTHSRVLAPVRDADEQAALDQGEATDRESAFLNCSTDTTRIRDYFRSEPNLEDLLSESGSRTLGSDEKARVEYLVGRYYEEIEVFELDAATKLSGTDVVPYFRVRTQSGSYGSESMGLGEFSLHLLAWFIRQLPAKSILLIEEPESFVAPVSQERIADVLAAAIDDKKLTVVVTTHSPVLVQRCPRECIHLVQRDGASVQIVPAPSDQALEASIGYRRSPRYGLLVEDRAAADLLRVLLRRFAPDLLSGSIISGVGLAGIRLGIQHAVDRGDGFKYVGVYDGDQRSAMAGSPSVDFLPTDKAPEEFLRDFVLSRPAELAAFLGRDVTEVNLAFQHAHGLDHHDWYSTLRKKLGLEPIETMSALVSVWLTDPSNATEADSLIARIRELCGC